MSDLDFTRLAQLRAGRGIRVANRPYLTNEGLNARKVQSDEGFALYWIDPAANHSKFYEGLMSPNGDGTFNVKFRWGALTDSGFTGRIDGAKFDRRQSMLSEREAKALLRKKYLAKTRKGYVDAWQHSGAKGQYPVGLRRDVGFGWGVQEAAFCTVGLRTIQDLLGQAQRLLGREDYVGAQGLQDEAAQVLWREGDSTMLKKVKSNLKHMQNRAIEVIAEPTASAVRNWKTAMSRLISYLDKQLGVCHGRSASSGLESPYRLAQLRAERLSRLTAAKVAGSYLRAFDKFFQPLKPYVRDWKRFLHEMQGFWTTESDLGEMFTDWSTTKTLNAEGATERVDYTPSQGADFWYGDGAWEVSIQISDRELAETLAKYLVSKSTIMDARGFQKAFTELLGADRKAKQMLSRLLLHGFIEYIKTDDNDVGPLLKDEGMRDFGWMAPDASQVRIKDVSIEGSKAQVLGQGITLKVEVGLELVDSNSPW